MLNLFYEHEEKDRWFKFDRYPRKVIRRLIRGKPRPSGQPMVAKELVRGLKRIGVPFRYNDYDYIRKHPEELVCCITSYLLFKHRFPNPIILGAVIYSHPVDCPELLQMFPNIKKVLMPGQWMAEMFRPYYGDLVDVWPVGIDTEKWCNEGKKATYDFLIYDKVRWEHEFYEVELINPIARTLQKASYSFQFIRYGKYDHDELLTKLSESKAVIFLCEHETQGLAYQQILSTGTPILAWDRGGYWQDPSYFPHRVKFEGVSSVPYWDHRCGEKFTSANDFEASLKRFIERRDKNGFKPREFILDNLTLESCAARYVNIWKSCSGNADKTSK